MSATRSTPASSAAGRRIAHWSPSSSSTKRHADQEHADEEHADLDRTIQIGPKRSQRRARISSATLWSTSRPDEAGDSTTPYAFAQQQAREAALS
jgi:hypothetical protein